MKAGKALNERKTEIRVQFKPPTAPIHGEAENMRNELVVCHNAAMHKQHLSISSSLLLTSALMSHSCQKVS